MHLNYLMMVNHPEGLGSSLLHHHNALRRAEALESLVSPSLVASRAAAAEKLLGAATAMAALARSPAKKVTGAAESTASSSRRSSTASLDGADGPSSSRSLLPQPPRVLEASYQLTQDDIIMGRHKLAFNHIGNRRFRALVTDSLQKYFAFPRRDQRSRLIQEIIQLVESSGGQFLKFCPKLGGRWVELDSTEKRNKVGHALRDTASSAKMFKKRFHVKEPVPPFVPKQKAPLSTSASLQGLAATSRQQVCDMGLAYSLADAARQSLPPKSKNATSSSEPQNGKVQVVEESKTAAKSQSIDMDLLMSLPYFAKQSEKKSEAAPA